MPCAMAMCILIKSVGTNGQGINQQLDIHYNSLQATYQDSLEFYRKLNGVSLDIIQRHWCRNVIGKGWTSSYHLTVRYYVVPVDINGRVKQAYAEVVAPDGNRIQFKHQQAASESNTNSGNNGSSSSTTSTQSSVLDGDYRPITGADFWLGSVSRCPGIRVDFGLCVFSGLGDSH